MNRRTSQILALTILCRNDARSAAHAQKNFKCLRKGNPRRVVGKDITDDSVDEVSSGRWRASSAINGTRKWTGPGKIQNNKL